MLSPYGLDIIESCLGCKMRAEHIFCDLPTAALQTFESIKYESLIPRAPYSLSKDKPRAAYLYFARAG